MESVWVVVSDLTSRRLSLIWCWGLFEFGSGLMDVSRDSVENMERFKLTE